MKILYGVQGTGHGHISRARVVLPKLRELAEVDVLISGYNFHMDLDGEVAYKKRGVSLTYDSNGSVDVLETAINLKPVKFIQDIQSTPVEDYDFIVNDFEPITAWAALAAGKPCVAISHQASFLSPKPPRPPKKSLVAEQVMRHFAPCTTPLGSHYLRYDDFIEPPIIRKSIKELNPVSDGHVTAYLPAFDHETLASIFSKIPQVQWHVYAPGCESAYEKQNVKVNPVSKDGFLKSLESCLGIVSSAGFETTSEALFLGKKLLVIPIRNQYEQLCNAAALEELGHKAVYSIGPDITDQLSDWIDHGNVVSIPEVCEANELAKKIFDAGVKSLEESKELSA